MVIQCKNLISLYILPDQRRGNLLVFNMRLPMVGPYMEYEVDNGRTQYVT